MSRESMERLEYLLAMRATDELSVAEEREIEELLADHPEVDQESYELAAAALLAEALDEQPLPAALRDKLQHEGEAFVSQLDKPGGVVRPAATRRDPAKLRDRPSHQALLGWLAAAACLMVAVAAWWPRVTGPTSEIEVVTRPAPDPAPATPAEQLSLLLDATDVQSLTWTATDNPAATGASGEVVWSPSRQQGFMRIRSLRANEPTAQQYQLWIFDRERDERYPVDGGVFDIPAGATEAIVPIDARVPVAEAYLFAVTVEQPGGVVVSDRERIVLLAQAGA